jgi:GntR family transcriptional regulator
MDARHGQYGRINPNERLGGQPLEPAAVTFLHPENDGSRGSAAYRELASSLRQAVADGRYPAGERLPTEAELVAQTGLSRQTVRRAFQELVADGTIYRVPGRGTFTVPGDGRYLRSFGSIDDLMALSLDTELEVVEPLHVLASVAIADQVQPGADTVMTVSFLRLHQGLRFCYTRVHVPMEIGRRLRELPEIAALAEPGARAPLTVISLMSRVIDRPIHSAAQNVTAVAADADVAHLLDCTPGQPVLRIDRLYRDRELMPLELAVNHFNPDRYSYQIQLRTQLDHSATSAGHQRE